MLSLRETQQRFARGVLGGADADKLIVSDWLKPEQRIAIYRHHYCATLREGLAASFPVIVRLVGEGFFNGMADAFTTLHPPSHPCLAEYGCIVSGWSSSDGPKPRQLGELSCSSRTNAKFLHAEDREIADLQFQGSCRRG